MYSGTDLLLYDQYYNQATYVCLQSASKVKGIYSDLACNTGIVITQPFITPIPDNTTMNGCRLASKHKVTASELQIAKPSAFLPSTSELT
jgi:hypothetical protein